MHPVDVGHSLACVISAYECPSEEEEALRCFVTPVLSCECAKSLLGEDASGKVKSAMGNT